MDAISRTLRATVSKISLFLILIEKKMKRVCQILCTECIFGRYELVCFVILRVWHTFFLCHFVPLLAPNPGDATGIVDRGECLIACPSQRRQSPLSKSKRRFNCIRQFVTVHSLIRTTTIARVLFNHNTVAVSVGAFDNWIRLPTFSLVPTIKTTILEKLKVYRPAVPVCD